MLSRHLQAPALPPLALRPRRLLGRHHLAVDMRFARVVDAVPALAEADAVLEVFHDRERLVRHLDEDIGREAHAVASQAARHPQVLAAGRAHDVKHAERDPHQARAPPRVEVANGVVGLHGGGARRDARVERSKQVRRDHGVRVDHGHRIGPPLGDDRLERVRQREPLAAALRVRALQNARTRRPGAGGRVVRAVVGDDENLEAVARVVDRIQALDRAGDPSGFVVRWNDDHESGPRLAVNGRLATPRPHGQDEQIAARRHDRQCRQRKEGTRDSHGNSLRRRRRTLGRLA